MGRADIRSRDLFNFLLGLRGEFSSLYLRVEGTNDGSLDCYPGYLMIEYWYDLLDQYLGR